MVASGALVDVFAVRSGTCEAVGALAFERALQVDAIGVRVAIVDSSCALVIVHAVAFAVLDESVLAGTLVSSNSVETIRVLAADRIIFTLVYIYADAVVVNETFVAAANEGAFSFCAASVDVTIHQN